MERLERDGEGLNLTEQVRDGILNHTGPDTPATLEGRIVRVVDRIAYINHDIDDALRAGVIAFADLPQRGDRGARHAADRSGSRPWSATCWSAREAAGDIVQGEEVGGAMLRLREFMFDRVYLGDRRPERARAGSSGCCARCSTTTPTNRRPPVTAGAAEHERVVDYLAGMTDRYAIRAFSELSVPQGF